MQADPLAGTGIGAERQHPHGEQVQLHSSVCPLHPPSISMKNTNTLQENYGSSVLGFLSHHSSDLQFGNFQMKVRGCWYVLPMHHPRSQPLIETSVLTSRFLCSEGLRTALPSAGGGQRVKITCHGVPSAGLVASQGPKGGGGEEQEARRRWGPDGEHCSEAMEAKVEEQDGAGNAERGYSISLARNCLP